MLLASLFLTVGAWAQTVTTINAEKWYQLKCIATDAAHGNGTNVWLSDLGTTFAGKSSTPTFFKFVPASEGKFYIYSFTSGRYVNVNGTALEQGETASTEWTIGTINEEGYVYLSSSDKNYLNNAGGTNNIQIKEHSSGVTSNNYCSLWYLYEYATTDINLGEVQANGSVSTTWAASTWLDASNIPDGVTEVETQQYPDATSTVKSASMTITAPAGYLAVTLAYADGNNRLDILGADLLNENGEVFASDYHFGYTGTGKSNNTYTLKVSAEGTYTIRYWVTFCREANTSTGNITLQHLSVLPVYSAAELSNDKVYTVTPSNTASTGAWDVNADATMLSLTIYTDDVDATDKNQQFAFLTVNGESYLYSYGAGKFVADNGTGQTLTDELSAACLTTFEASTVSNKAVYPMVVAVGGAHLCATDQSSYTNYGGIVTNWNDTGDAGNAVAIVPVDGTVDLSDAIATIEAYQTTVAKEELVTLIAEATTLAGKSYINSTALEAAIATAEDVANESSATYDQVTEQIELLNAAIVAAGYVSTIDGFSNNAIYTFVSNRSATAYMMYDGETNYVASQYMKTSLEVGEDIVNCQWAVYKSTNGYYYMYNLGAQKFMGTQSAANTSIPFSDTPQTTGLTFKVSAVATHPIMFSTDGGAGAANHSNNSFDGKNQAGLITWAGGFGYTSDGGNVHKVAIVGELAEETLATIAAAVATYEERGIAIQELGDYLDEFYANYYDGWGSGWRNQAGVNNYSQPEGDQALNEAYEEARTFYNGITDETAVVDITAKKTYLEGLEANLTINQPEVGKFYRLRCVAGTNYLSSTTSAVSDTDSEVRFEMAGQNATNPDLMFMYDGTALLSYSKGLYANTHAFNNVGVKSTVTFQAAANKVIGQYNINVNNRYIYGAGNTKNNHIDSGTGNPTATSTNGYNWWLEEVTTLPVAVSAAGYATLYAPVALEVPAEGVTAHTVTIDDDKAILSEALEVIPAETGVILVGTEGTHNFTVTTTNETATSALAGTFAKTYVTDDAYVLAKKNDVVGLYKAIKNQQEETAFLNNAFKAYLPAPVGSEAPMFSFGRGEGTTAIDQIISNDGELVIYDLAGRRVQKMEKGIYIVNGKKVIK